ncbi:MAG: hypothetical protein ACQEXX_24975 [Bacillota bacterium]
MKIDKDDLKGFIIDEFLQGEYGCGFDENFDLIRNGVIDSFSIFHIVSFIEDRLDIEIQMELLNKEDFRSITSMIKFVNTL